MSKKVIILNGPPGVGKDTIAALLTNHERTAVSRSFKEPMFNIALAMLGRERYSDFVLAYHNREEKEKPHSFLNGKTCREFMIWISEDVIKPTFGKQHFGKLMADNIASVPEHIDVVVSDGGFKDELLPLIGAGFDVHVIRLHRDGFTFAGDSRDYLETIYDFDNLKFHDFTLYDGLPKEAADAIYELVMR